MPTILESFMSPGESTRRFGPTSLMGHRVKQLGKSKLHDLPLSGLEKALISLEEKPWQQPRYEKKRQVAVKVEICEASFHRAFS